MTYTVTKTLRGHSTAHRVWDTESHCRFVHGYDRTFEIVFGCDRTDERTGFVVDFGSLTTLKKHIEDQFDHTLIVAPSDPLLDRFRQLHELGAVDLRIMEHPGMEGAACWVFHQAMVWAQHTTEGRAWCVSVTAHENDKNAATYGRDHVPLPDLELNLPAEVGRRKEAAVFAAMDRVADNRAQAIVKKAAAGAPAGAVALLAEIAHDEWAHWTSYMLHEIGPEGAVVWRELYDRWLRQSRTSYDDLSAQEQASDLERALVIHDRLVAAGYLPDTFKRSEPAT